MTQHSARSDLRPDAVVPGEGRRSAWVGWVIFAGMVMILVGAFNAIDGLVALFNDDFYVVGQNDLLVLDFTASGWFFLIFGLVTLVSGFGVLAGQIWARVVGVALAVLNAVGHLVFLNAHPAWSVMIITLDVIVIFALTTHGRDLA